MAKSKAAALCCLKARWLQLLTSDFADNVQDQRIANKQNGLLCPLTPRIVSFRCLFGKLKRAIHPPCLPVCPPHPIIMLVQICHVQKPALRYQALLGAVRL
jgi:hypothetical protein